MYFSVVRSRDLSAPNDFHTLDKIESRLFDFPQIVQTDHHTVQMEVHQKQ